MRTHSRVLLVLGALGGLSPFAAPVAAQEPDFAVVDRIVAIVGNTAITLSRIDEELNLMRARGTTLPTDSAGLADQRRRVLDRLIDDELVVQQALNDTTIKISDQEVLTAVDEAVRTVRQEFPSELEFQRQIRSSGFGTVDEYRRWFADNKRRELLTSELFQKLRQKGQLRPIAPSEAEAREFYQRARGQQKRPATVSFRQIVVRPKPDSAATAAARVKADSILIEIRRGADFATVAKRFSDDISSRERGGDLGWFRRGQMVREFDFAVFRLKPGQFSEVVQTPFGFHLIQLQRVEPAEALARHILISPLVSEQNLADARALADSVKRLLQAGAPLDSLARLYNDPGEETLAEGVERSKLPEVYQTAFADAKPGDVLGPVPLTLGVTKYAVIVFREALAEGEMSYDELRDQIKSRLAEQGALTRYVQGLRAKTYVSVKL